ncbi:hypothetical protein AVEN_169806-1 [Araneus ventricosus]|uniref:Uncharacterized protein n=1 Tax=Araneus ventricosus TaxID=182803 RepID=A0A4Y2P7U2_ARAVE|nr:hypothetical protein AVEN_169806-1 [Araneus ventricosus]
MEKQLSCVLMLPLKQIALRRFAATLWNEPDILASIGKFRERIQYGDYQKKWCGTVEFEVLDKISKLQLPESLTKQIIQILKPMGLRILRWKIFHEAFLSQSNCDYPFEYFNVSILEKLCWTTAGTVDYRKTAEELILCNVVDIVKRYKLACLYCLDHYIPEFWKELPQENKMYFYNRKHIRLPLLQFCWPYILKGEEYKLCVNSITGNPFGDSTLFQQRIFTCLSFAGNKAAVKYFFQKLSLEEREASLINAANSALGSQNVEPGHYPWRFPKENVTDVVFYLLSLMNPEQQSRFFRERPSDVLECFLDWPWQDAFLNIADAMWRSGTSCKKLRHSVGQDAEKDSKFRLLFTKFVPEFFPAQSERF